MGRGMRAGAYPRGWTPEQVPAGPYLTRPFTKLAQLYKGTGAEPPVSGQPAEPVTPAGAQPAPDLGLPESPQVAPLDPATAAAREKVMAGRAKVLAGEKEAHAAAHGVRDQLPDEVFQPHPDINPETGAEIPHPLAGARIRDVWDELVNTDAKLHGTGKPYGSARLKAAQRLEAELGLPGRLEEGEDPEVIAQDIADAFLDRHRKLQAKQQGKGGGEAAGPEGGEPPEGGPTGPSPAAAAAQEFGDAVSVGPDGTWTFNRDVEMATASGTFTVPAGTPLTPENLAKIRSVGGEVQPGAETPGGESTPNVPRGTSPSGEGGTQVTTTETAAPGTPEYHQQLSDNYRAMNEAARANPDLHGDPAFMEAYNRVEEELIGALQPVHGEATFDKLDELAGVGQPVAPPALPAPAGGTEPSALLSRFGPKEEQVAHRYAQAMAEAGVGDREAIGRAAVMERHLREAMARYGATEDEQNAFLSWLESRGSTGLPAGPRGTEATPLQQAEGAAPGRETSAAPGRINDPLLTSGRLFAKEVMQAVDLIKKIGGARGGGGALSSRWESLLQRRHAGGDAEFAADAHKAVQDLVRLLDTKRPKWLLAATTEDPKKARLVEDALGILRGGAGPGGRPRGGSGGGGSKGGIPGGGGGGGGGKGRSWEDVLRNLRAKANIDPSRPAGPGPLPENVASFDIAHQGENYRVKPATDVSEPRVFRLRDMQEMDIDFRSGTILGPKGGGGGGPQTGGRLTPEEARRRLGGVTDLPTRDQLEELSHRVYGTPLAQLSREERQGLVQTAGKYGPEHFAGVSRAPARGYIPLSEEPNPGLVAAERRLGPERRQLPPDMERHALVTGHQVLSEGIKSPDAWKRELNRRLDGAFNAEQLDYLWERATGKVRNRLPNSGQRGLTENLNSIPPYEPTGHPSAPVQDDLTPFEGDMRRLFDRNLERRQRGITEVLTPLEQRGGVRLRGGWGVDRPAPQMEYQGYQAGNPGGKLPGFHLYTLLEDIPGHNKGSTISEHTLRNLGYAVPPPPGK